VPSTDANVKYLAAWIGRQDLDGSRQDPPTGPIVDFVRSHPHVTAVLLSDWPRDEANRYAAALRRTVSAPINLRYAKLKDPTDYLGIYRAADELLRDLTQQVRADQIAVHTSPGTSAMASVRILLAKTKYAGAKRFKSWLDKTGTPQLAEVNIPFELSLDVLPDIAARRATLLAPADAQLPVTNAFDALVHPSTVMTTVIRDAHRAAAAP
jgi:hypothetical protein